MIVKNPYYDLHICHYLQCSPSNMFVNTVETLEKYVVDVFTVQQPRGPGKALAMPGPGQGLFVVFVCKNLLGFEAAMF